MNLGKVIGSLALSTIAALGFAGAAQAVENTWTVYNGANDGLRYIGSGSSYSWTHDIRDNTGTPDGLLFDPAYWTVTDADMYIYLYDDGDWTFEFVTFRFDRNRWTPVDNEVDNNTTYHADLNNAWLADGILNVILRSTRGDFYYDYARLVVKAVRRVTEPGTLALLGLGLIALGFVARGRARLSVPR